MPAFDGRPDFDIGYTEPGHGVKGKNQWLNTDDDVKSMHVCKTCKETKYSFVGSPNNNTNGKSSSKMN